MSVDPAVTVYQAIADPTRRAILEMLRDGERSVSALLACFRMSQPALSQHLGVLRRAGLVKNRKAGRRRLYALTPEPLRQVDEWVSVFDAFWTRKLGDLGRYLDAQQGATPHGQAAAPAPDPVPPTEGAA